VNLEPELPRQRDVLLRDIGLGAVRGNPGQVSTEIVEVHLRMTDGPRAAGVRSTQRISRSPRSGA
jgi:hypothetical protein